MSKFEFKSLKLSPISDQSTEPLLQSQPEIQSQSKTKKPPSLISTLIEKHADTQNDSLNLGVVERGIEEEIHKYFITQIAKEDVETFDILQLWKNHSTSLPKLARLSKKI